MCFADFVPALALIVIEDEFAVSAACFSAMNNG